MIIINIVLKGPLIGHLRGGFNRSLGLRLRLTLGLCFAQGLFGLALFRCNTWDGENFGMQGYLVLDCIVVYIWGISNPDTFECFQGV